MLDKERFNKVSKSIMKYGRGLEKSLFKKYFNNASDQLVINELKKFQNEDGGFGHGIESDFRLPYSSPMATSVGVRISSKVNSLDESKEMIKAAIEYLERSFCEKRNGWFAVSKEVNNFPHAPWWHYSEDLKMTVIDKNWGNPSAEILAYLYKYREYVRKLNVDNLVEYAINYIENKKEFNSENELFCYIKLYKVLPKKSQKRLEKVISLAIDEVINYDEKRWHEYVPTPLDFVKSSNGFRFGVLESKINDNLDFVIKKLESNDFIKPPWGKSFYKDELKEAYDEWIGVLGLKSLVT